MKCTGSDLLGTLELMRRNLVAGKTDRYGYIAGIAELFEARVEITPATDTIIIGKNNDDMTDEIIRCH
jgi:hypothetical protein